MAGRGLRLGAVLQGLGLTVGLLGLIGGFALLAFQYRPYSVPTDSMEPTVRPGEVILAHPVRGGAVGRGDVVVFRDPLWGTANEVKRVIGVGGDTVACCDTAGRTTVDGHPVTEPYLNGGELGSNPAHSTFSATVPTGHLFLLGDNRAVSLDSRSHLDVTGGSVPTADVVARVEGTVWPLGSAGTTGRSTAFDALPGPHATAHGPLAPLVALTIGGAVLVLLTAALGTVGGQLRKLRSRRG